MSVSCIPEVFDKDIAKRTLWDAILYDEEDKPLAWSGLIKTTNVPKISFTIEDTLGGTSKAYSGWKLPDNISLTIWETDDHDVEKYLDEWMLGKQENGKTKQGTGVFNMDTGSFQEAKYGVLYRKLIVRTFHYEVPQKKASLTQEQNESKYSAEITQEEHSKDSTLLQVKQLEHKVGNFKSVFKRQPIPGLDKLTALANGVTSLAKSKIPVSTATALIPPLIIPPLMMQYPNPITVFPKYLVQLKEVEKFKIASENKEKQKVSKSKSSSKAKSDIVQQGEVKEVVTSLVTYKVAIEGYDIGTYDYQTGEGVSYTVNLAVCDIKTEH